MYMYDLLIIMLLYLFGSSFLLAKSLGCLLTSNLSLLVACSPSLSSLLSSSTIQIPKKDRCRFTNKLQISLTLFSFWEQNGSFILHACNKFSIHHWLLLIPVDKVSILIKQQNEDRFSNNVLLLNSRHYNYMSKYVLNSNRFS